MSLFTLSVKTQGKRTEQWLTKLLASHK